MTSPTFAGHTAVVTGAAGAIGQAIASRLLERGATVCVAGRASAALRATIAEREWPVDRALPYIVDLDDIESIAQFCGDVEREHPEVHVLVHCAGTIAMEDRKSVV